MPEIPSTANRILATLSIDAFSEIYQKFERIPLNFSEDIYKPGDVIQHVYFPESGIISLLSAVEEKSTLEVGIVGNEGVVGIPVFLGVKTSNSHALVQGSGSALRLSVSDFNEECDISRQLPRYLNRYLHCLLTQIWQSAACNRFHAVESRLARWLLMTQDRMQIDEFRITQ